MTAAADDAADLEVVPLLLELPPTDIAFVKFIFESYEGIAVIRTLDRSRATIVALVSRDFVAVADAIIDSLRTTVPLKRIDPPPPLCGRRAVDYVLEDTMDVETAAGS